MVATRSIPADFIAEGVDQTRGWFYSLLAIATGLGDALPNNGDTSGGAVSRRRRERHRARRQGRARCRRAAATPSIRGRSCARHGADAVRLFLIASSQVWVPRRFDESMIREKAGRFLLTLKNVYSGIFAQYANFGWAPSEADPAPADRPVMDRWMLSRLATVEREIDDATRAVRRDGGCARAHGVRRRRRLELVRAPQSRAASTMSTHADNRAAFATLHEVLVVITPAARAVRAVRERLDPPRADGTRCTSHHFAASWVQMRRERGARARDERVRMLAKLGRAAREEKEIKVRQPLSRLVCVVPISGLRDLADLLPLLASELNVKRVEFARERDALVTLVGEGEFRSLGQEVRQADAGCGEARRGARRATQLLAFERGETVNIDAWTARTHPLLPDDVTIVARIGEFARTGRERTVRGDRSDDHAGAAARRNGTRAGQQDTADAKGRGFAVSDRIDARLAAARSSQQVVDEYESYIAGEVLANEVTRGRRPRQRQLTQCRPSCSTPRRFALP